MRHHRAVLFALALFAATSAQAASPADADAAFQRISTEQLFEMQGDYQLSNGHRLVLTELDQRLYAVLGKHDRRELLATGDNTFTTRDGSISLRFQPGADGNHIVLTNADSTDRSLARVFNDAQRNKQASLSPGRLR